MQPTSTPGEILARKEQYYPRNFISLMFESFFFSSALTLFSTESVLPVYVSHLSAEPFWLSLIAVINYGVSYAASFFSCVIGVNAKSPKWTSVRICFLQRIGFFLILLSTMMAGGSTGAALAVFFVSLTLYSLSAGMSTPLFVQMVSTSIHRNVGTFYGAYTLVGAGSGVLATLVLTRCLEKYRFPENFRWIFLFGLLAALVATAVVSIGVREVTDDRQPAHISLGDVLPMIRNVLKNNRRFRNYALVRMLMGAAEFAIPYYIVAAGALPGLPDGFVGKMATLFLVSKMAASLLLGRLGDRFGATRVLQVSCVCGVGAALLAITMRGPWSAAAMYALLAAATDGIYMSTSVASATYGSAQETPVYMATVSLMCAPLYILASFGGALVAKIFTVNGVFAVALAAYLTGALLIFRLREQ